MFGEASRLAFESLPLTTQVPALHTPMPDVHTVAAPPPMLAYADNVQKIKAKVSSGLVLAMILNTDSILVSELFNVFETFLPQLLLYPNPTDPLNGEAAALLMKEPEAYANKVRGMPALPAPACTAVLTSSVSRFPGDLSATN